MSKGALREKGLSHDEIISELEGHKANDLKWRGGSAFSYVYHAGEDVERVGKEAYMMYLSENGLDPTVFKSLLEFDTAVVEIGLRHLNAPEGAVGNFTSGGTESIICAVKAARNYARKVRGIAEPNIVIPVTAHAAFHKAAHYLDMECRVAPVDTTTFKADVDAMAELTDANTALLVGSAASYAHGVIDPIAELGQLALDRGVLLHVDGCIGGWLLPYFKRLGGTVEDFDFSVPGVTSISMDYHKYAYCPKGASVVLYRDAALRHHQIFSCADWSGYTVVNAVVQSSRTGGPMAAAYAVLNYVGDEGYLELARKLKTETEIVIDGVESIDGLHIMGEPRMSLLAIGIDPGGPSPFEVADLMTELGWHVQPQLSMGDYPANIHLTIAPQNVGRMEDFIDDLADAYDRAEEAHSKKKGPGFNPAAAMLNNLDISSIDANAISELLKMVGVNGSEMPEKMGPIHTLLDSMPTDARNHVLTAYFNALYTS